MPCQIWKSLFLPAHRTPELDIDAISTEMADFIETGVDALLLDTVDASSGKTRFGGTGRTNDWNLAAELIDRSTVPMFLSGGITPSNVREAITQVRPYGIDLCSGVESAKGVRDSRKLALLMQALQPITRPRSHRLPADNQNS